MWVVSFWMVAGCGNGSSSEESSDAAIEAVSGEEEGTGEAGDSAEVGEPAIEGLKSVYMGHSYFRKQAENMVEYAEIAGIEGHQSTTLFNGGYKGSAAAIWEDVVPGSKKNIQDQLDEGDVQMFGMTVFMDPEAPEGDVTHMDSQMQGLKNWIEYGLSRNTETIFFVALPWLGGPLTYVGDTGDPQTSGYEEYEEAILGSEEGMREAIDELRESFPEAEIFLLAYGQGSLELRTLYNLGNLPDVDTLVSGEGLLEFTAIPMGTRNNCSPT